jgi:hypothetical protein
MPKDNRACRVREPEPLSPERSRPAIFDFVDTRVCGGRWAMVRPPVTTLPFDVDCNRSILIATVHRRVGKVDF